MNRGVRSENLPDSVKVPVIEDEKKLVFVFDTLHRVRYALGEIPDVTFLDGRELELSFVVDSCYYERARVQIAPFRLSVAVSIYDSTNYWGNGGCS